MAASDLIGFGCSSLSSLWLWSASFAPFQCIDVGGAQRVVFSVPAIDCSAGNATYQVRIRFTLVC
jgi:hypothetical protein